MEREIIKKLENYKVIKQQKKIYILESRLEEAEILEKEIKIIDNAIDVLNGIEKEIIKERYLEEISWEEISKNKNLSKSGCYKIRKRALNKLKNTLNKKWVVNG